jgi:DNA-directed RNA polymerase subunit RPC12/RpoP
MASTIAISCPNCDKDIQVPADLAGKKIRCKECQEVFVVKAPAPPPRSPAKKPKPSQPSKPAKKEEPEEQYYDDDGSPYKVTSMDFVTRCPYCAKEMESDDAVICLNCGYNTQTRFRVESKKTFERTGGDWFWWLLPGIGCALGVLLTIGIIVVFWLLFPDWYEEVQDWYGGFFGLWARLWGTVIMCFIGFILAKFAIKRLIFNYLPPEKEKKGV